MKQKSSFEKLVEFYKRGVRYSPKRVIESGAGDLVLPSKKIEYIITFGPIELVSYYKEKPEGYWIVELIPTKSQDNVKSIERSGAGHSLDDYLIASDTLTFKRRKDETKSDLIYRILMHAQEHGKKNQMKVDTIKLLHTNLNKHLNKPLKAVYYSEKTF